MRVKVVCCPLYCNNSPVKEHQRSMLSNGRSHESGSGGVVTGET